MNALVRIYVDDLNAGRDVTALWCSCAFDLSQSIDCQSERASASSELHSWLRLWCSRTCQDRLSRDLCCGAPRLVRMTNIIILRCNHHIVDIRKNWIVLSSRLHQQLIIVDENIELRNVNIGNNQFKNLPSNGRPVLTSRFMFRKNAENQNSPRIRCLMNQRQVSHVPEVSSASSIVNVVWRMS